MTEYSAKSKVDNIVNDIKQRKQDRWKNLQQNNPAIAQAMIDFAKVFGKPEKVIVTQGGKREVWK